MDRIEPRLDMYATSCGDAGWGRRGAPHQGRAYTDHSVGDVMKCRLMVGALFFIPGWSNPMHHDKDQSENDTAMKAIMRCMVANVFAYILAAIKCRYEWPGVDRAWTIMQELAVGSGDPSNPISRGTCTQDTYKDIKIGTGNLQAAVKKWLQQSTKIRDSIKQIEKNPKCKMHWEMYKKNLEARREDADLSSIFKKATMQTLVKEQIKEVLTTISKKVHKKVQKARNRPEGSTHLGDSALDSSDEEEEEQNNAEKDMTETKGKHTTPKTTSTNSTAATDKPADGCRHKHNGHNAAQRFPFADVER
ncbi:hypothetical protein AK88_05314 [Plasmodium fragile]|uniref:Schizont-infected cell agglutination extracellular alpha domain-containing protein n=1 Tax=Plasmodium fragile TaxID=5857 RepID=A0A0D9QDK1_PLAFR|nr:uncharacterized protein AK88_05314 [Plasmodium fragile]KJP85059.1 hypothetical protein AK88_05314 [Plasmodium fragile]